MNCGVRFAAAGALFLGGCGKVAQLQPEAGQALPVKPLMAKTTPTAQELLAVPDIARPQRVDELMRRSEPREPDRFDLPPPDGGPAPTIAGDAPILTSEPDTGPVQKQ